jgi:hypothetical protein
VELGEQEQQEKEAEKVVENTVEIYFILNLKSYEQFSACKYSSPHFLSFCLCRPLSVLKIYPGFSIEKYVHSIYRLS